MQGYTTAFEHGLMKGANAVSVETLSTIATMEAELLYPVHCLPPIGICTVTQVCNSLNWPSTFYINNVTDSEFANPTATVYAKHQASQCLHACFQPAFGAVSGEVLAEQGGGQLSMDFASMSNHFKAR